MNGWLVGWLAGYMPLALTHVDSIRSLGSSSHAMHACMSFVSRTIFLFFFFFSLSFCRFVWAGTEQVCLRACLTSYRIPPPP